MGKKRKGKKTISYLDAAATTKQQQEQQEQIKTNDEDSNSESNTNQSIKTTETIETIEKKETKEEKKEEKNKNREEIETKEESKSTTSATTTSATTTKKTEQKVIQDHIIMTNETKNKEENKKEEEKQRKEEDKEEIKGNNHQTKKDNVPQQQQQQKIKKREQEAEKGKDGNQGTPGEDGGERDAPGGDGERGEDGKTGENGKTGKAGKAAPNYRIIIESIKGERGKVKITTTKNEEETKTRIHEVTDTIVIDARGQDGENGQDGGKGGAGGKGGNGGKGGVVIEQNNDRIQKRGCSGGDGGPGGDGGKGGNGGNGGSGGKGGNVIVESDNSKYFMMFDIHVEGGAAGAAGAAGKGGAAGPGGEAGKSGLGNVESMKGKPGKQGSRGKEGIEGRPGLDGTLTYVNNKTNEKSPFLFNVNIDSFEVEGVDDDGILEPGENIVIKGIKLSNTGGMELPEDCILKIQSNQHVEIVASVSIPKIAPNQQLDFETEITGSITTNLQLEQLPQQTFIEAYCILLDKKIPTSIKSVPILIQYPIRINKLINPPTVSIGSEGKFTLEIQNISRKNYGGTNSKIAYEIHSNVNVKHTIKGQLDMIQNSSTKSIPIPFTMKETLAPFTNGEWTVDLYFKNEKIQRKSATLRLCHQFNPNEETDCLLITDANVSEQEYKAYQQIFNKIGLNFNIFDVELEGTFNHTWNKYSVGKSVVCAISSAESFTNIKLEHVIDHFTQNEHKPLLESGFVFVGGDVKAEISKSVFSFASSTEQIPDSQLTDWFISSTPTRRDFEKKLSSIQKSYAKKNQMYQYKIVEQSFSPVYLGMTKYQYGSAIALQSPLKNTTSMYIISDFDKTRPYHKDFLSSQPLTTENGNINVESTQFEVMTSIIFSLSILKRLEIASSLSSRTSDEQIQYVVKKKRYSLKHLLAMSLFYDFKHEFYIENSKMHKMMETLKALKNDYTHLLTKDVAFVLCYAILRLNNTSWARSLINSSVSKNKPYVEQAVENLYEIFKNAGFDFEGEKLAAVKLSTSSSRATFVDIFKRTERLYPFPFN